MLKKKQVDLLHLNKKITLTIWLLKFSLNITKNNKHRMLIMKFIIFKQKLNLMCQIKIPGFITYPNKNAR